MSDERWTEGLSATSIGRFGGLRADLIPYNSGYLTANATATRLYLADGDKTVELGWYQLPRDFTQKTTTDWTSNRYEFSAADGTPHSKVTHSLLFPGFRYALRTGRFEYYWRIRGYGATRLVLPLAAGVTAVPATDGYDAARDGELARPWVLFSFAGSAMPFDYPMMFTFDRRPARIEVWTQEYLRIHFAAADATVVQIHPFGAERLDHKRTAAWEEHFPAEDEARMDLWAAAALAYPVRCRELFRIDEQRRVLKVRNEFEYEEAHSDWSVDPLHLAPLPPVLASARRYLTDGPRRTGPQGSAAAGPDLLVRGEILEELCPTFLGWYEAVRGESLEYEIPLSRFRNHTLAPMRVEKHPLAEEITDRLTDYLTGGEYLTFGGDEDYDADCSLDSLHDLRIMAWATWSIDPRRRGEVFDLLTRGLRGVPEEDYLEFTAPFTGTAWARHRSFFRYRGVVDYDSEWYNGMILAGLWEYHYFTTDDRPLELIRSRWPLIRKLFGYYQAFTDWALQVVWTSARGECVWLDGINYAYEGMLAFAAMARSLGQADEAAWGDYLAAKAELFIRTCWNSAAYVERFFPRPAAVPVVASGYYEGMPIAYGDNSGFSCGNYGYAVREVLLLLRDMKKEDELSGGLRRFEKRFPRWRRSPYEAAAKADLGEWHARIDPRPPIHHYFLDPRLMVSALVLEEDVRELMDVGATLTAPVLECALVSLAPRLLVPREARFLGAVWDDQHKTLTLKLSGSGRVTVGLAHASRPREIAPEPLGAEESESRIFYTFRLDGETEMVFSF